MPVVTTLNDVVDAGDGQTSLREAILETNTGNPSAFDSITFADTLSGTIRLTSSLPQITQQVLITGNVDSNGKPVITISGDVGGDDPTVAGTNITDLSQSISLLKLSDNVQIFNVAATTLI